MAVKVIIRDDDVDYFCHPKMLDKIYGSVWRAEKSVCLSVIPRHRADVKLPQKPSKPNQQPTFNAPNIPSWLYKLLYRYDTWKQGRQQAQQIKQSQIYDPSIPKHFIKEGDSYVIAQNSTLCSYLNQQIAENRVEICLHGYFHTYLEFRIFDKARVKSKLVKGKQILQQAFPQANITTFIAPYDYLTGIATKLILDQGFHLCTRSEVYERTLYTCNLSPLRDESLLNVFRYGKTNIILCDFYLFNDLENPNDCLRNALLQLDRLKNRRDSVLVIANHYWQFFQDWSVLNYPLYKCWRVFLDIVLNDDEIEVTTFSKV